MTNKTKAGSKSMMASLPVLVQATLCLQSWQDPDPVTGSPMLPGRTSRALGWVSPQASPLTNPCCAPTGPTPIGSRQV